MEVSNPNNVKIYNLSNGKSLPEWLSERKRRTLQNSDINVRRRIELLQDFDMPTVSDCIQVTKDGQFILATGTYKPRVRCYDVQNLSMKFERCFDAEVVKFELLSDDYSKIAFLQCDRFVEFHAKYGKYYRTRIPKFGRDMAYHRSSCDLYFVGASNEVFRLNLEQGKFLNSFVTDSISLNVCKINPVHELFVCGSVDGRVEAWDPRSRYKVGVLDCALNSVTNDTEVNGIPSVTSLSFKDGLNLAVGTATGQILLYDIRSNKPLFVKDHMYGLPIKNVEFHTSMDVVLSMDTKILKIWNRNNGRAFTSIEPSSDLNDLCLVPHTGLMFLANEGIKMMTYYIPSLGPAPRWCSFLDNLTEELEESTTDVVYDDYKFLTRKELEELGFSHLIGSNLLRAYMHGYFIDMRLYHKAKAIVEPFSFDDYRKKKIKEKLDKESENRVKIHKLPKVNKVLANKLMNREYRKRVKGKSLLEDDRFKVMFENPDYEIDNQTEEYRLRNPSVSRLERRAEKEISKQELLAEQFETVEDEEKEEDGVPSSEEEEEDSSDDEHTWAKDVKQSYMQKRNEEKLARKQANAAVELKPKFLVLKPGEEYGGVNKLKTRKSLKASLGERLDSNVTGGEVVKQNGGASFHREMTFTFKKPRRENAANRAREEHFEERRKIGRSAKSIETKRPKGRGGGPWTGRR